MVRVLRALAIFRVLVVLAAFVGIPAAGADSTLVVKWNETLLECVRLSKIGPPMVARAIGVTYTCGFDAWTAYDDVAVSTQPAGVARRPAAERTEANRGRAFSFAVYRALLDLFPGQTDYIRDQMSALGYDPDNTSSDVTVPPGVGNVCALAVLDFRHADGSNQLGNLHPGPYSDYTGYQSVNDADHINDPNRWQPLRFCDGHGGFVTPTYIAPQWGNVIPFAMTSPSEFRPPPPQQYPHGGYVAQIEEELRLNAHLDDRQKVIAEYWADGPRSELPPGHWTLFGEFVSDRDAHTFDQDVKMFFMLGNAVMDAGIAVWEAKRFYDSERPITAIHFLKAGKKVLATVPFKGKQVINGADWMPYQPCTFVTPPFPEYPSGHSAFSAAGAEILKRFSGSDAFGASATRAVGSSKVEPGYAPATDVTLSWATFSEAADEAGFSRRLGGIHFEDGDLASRKLGRQVGAAVWDKAQSYINGTAVEALALRRSGRQMLPEMTAGPRAELGALRVITLGPNPTSSGARLEFEVPRGAVANASVVDLAGREVARLGEGEFASGRYSVSWDGRSNGHAVPAGIYFVHVRSPGQAIVRPLIVVQ